MEISQVIQKNTDQYSDKTVKNQSLWKGRIITIGSAFLGAASLYTGYHYLRYLSAIRAINQSLSSGSQFGVLDATKMRRYR